MKIEKKLKDNIIFLYNQITKGCFRNHCYNNLCITNKIAQQINITTFTFIYFIKIKFKKELS